MLGSVYCLSQAKLVRTLYTIVPYFQVLTYGYVVYSLVFDTVLGIRYSNDVVMLWRCLHAVKYNNYVYEKRLRLTLEHISIIYVNWEFYCMYQKLEVYVYYKGKSRILERWQNKV